MREALFVATLGLAVSADRAARRYYLGCAGNFFPGNGMPRRQDWMKTTQNRHYRGSFLYGARKDHCYAER
jgi:hypothetical protein